MKNYFVLLVSCLALVGCNGGKGGSGDSSPVQNPVMTEGVKEFDDELEIFPSEFETSVKRRVELKSDLSNLEEFKNNLNNYKIFFTATHGSFKNHAVVCTDATSDKEVIPHTGKFDYLGEEAQIWVNLYLNHLKPVVFLCRVTGESFDQMVEVKIKKSIELNSNNKVSSLRTHKDEELDLDTLILNPNASIHIDEEDLYLKANTIVSLNGKLMTFPPRAEARPGREGMSGGYLKVRAGKVIGDLGIELRGQNGGFQSERPKKPSDIPPTPDYLHGRCVENQENYKGECQGKKGIKGYNGEMGYMGLPGGNTGHLELFVKGLRNSEIKVNYFPGLGSQGGEGGEGGDGGFGGRGVRVRYRYEGGAGPHRIDAISTNQNTKCVQSAVRQQSGSKGSGYIYYKDGDCGDKGEKGQRGEPGYNGGPETSYIHLLDERISQDIDENWSYKGSL